MHRAGWSKTNYEDSYTTIDVEDQTMQVDYTIGLLRETYTTWSVSIPVQLALRWKQVTVYLGPKAVFPLAANRQQDAMNAALSVYYPDYDNRVYESYPLAASRSFEMHNSGKKSHPIVQAWLSAEVSYSIPFNVFGRTFPGLSIGIYADYCVMRNTNSNTLQPSLIQLTDTRDGLPLSRILSPIEQSSRQGKKLLSTYTPFDVGLKISYYISSEPAHPRPNKSCHCR